MIISRFDVIIYGTIAIMVTLAIAGYVYDNWQPMCIAIVIIGILMVLNTMSDCVDDHIPSRNGKTFIHVPGVNVNVHCTQYVPGTNPFYIEFCDIRVAKIYRGNDIVISIPEGIHNIRVYRDPHGKFDNEVTISEGCELYLNSDNDVIPKYHLSNHVDEQEDIRTYNEFLKRTRPLAIEACILGIPSLIAFILGMFKIGMF